MQHIHNVNRTTVVVTTIVLIKMACTTANDSSPMARVMSEEFLRKILDQMKMMLKNISGWERHLFHESDKFIKEVEDFKACLLRFVLKAKIHLNFLINLFNKPKYQQNEETAKVALICNVMNEIDRGELVNYLSSCEKLITTSIRLHTEYGKKSFKLKFVLCKVFNFMTIGAVVGAAVGLVLPFCAPLEVLGGAIVGITVGFVSGLFEVIFNWDKHSAEIEKVRNNLIDIQTALQKVIQQIQSTHDKLGEGQVAVKYQAAHTRFQDAESLEQYVRTALEQFVCLETLLLPTRPIK